MLESLTMKFVVLFCMIIAAEASQLNPHAFGCHRTPSCVAKTWKYVVKGHKSSFNHAESICARTLRRLAMPKTAEDVALLQDVGYGLDLWIGLKKTVDRDWHWVDNTSLGDYRPWGSGQPNVTRRPTKYNPICVFLSRGKWYEGTCKQRLAVVCQKPEFLINETCQDLGRTTLYGDYCYHFLWNTDMDRNGINFTEAQKHCEKYGGMLAEPRNKEEFYKLKELYGLANVWIGVQDIEGQNFMKEKLKFPEKYPENSHKAKYVWVSDKQEVDFSYWFEYQTDRVRQRLKGTYWVPSYKKNCVALARNSRWEDLECSDRERDLGYVCQMDAIRDHRRCIHYLCENGKRLCFKCSKGKIPAAMELGCRLTQIDSRDQMWPNGERGMNEIVGIGKWQMHHSTVFEDDVGGYSCSTSIPIHSLASRPGRLTFKMQIIFNYGLRNLNEYVDAKLPILGVSARLFYHLPLNGGCWFLGNHYGVNTRWLWGCRTCVCYKDNNPVCQGECRREIKYSPSGRGYVNALILLPDLKEIGK